ncbi:ATP-binding cassette domain-containing protein [Pseudonocardia sp. HH130630-07]|uniref:ATP-binding cassette domain-containing protein n=1 Tax=Pseudonocardia sp. HH130630-07 TaxID=1690815 RepID=UPI0008151C47|nr:ATP-binding cassette domain-containing protein [Pseudonocardia sp. HH130630-07]ANY05233.1 bacitracin ABC transporter ATP-binding protein [Pseudonocardia sp. HH130630-07]
MNDPNVPVVRCDGVRAVRGGRTVLDGMSLQVRPGTVYALLGRNGAGKSTTFRVLLGLHRPRSGSVELFGAPWRRAALARVGATVDGPALYEHLSAAENLRVHALLTGTPRARIGDVLDLVGLAGTGRRRAARFSTGMRARLALGIALLADPALLLLDEPQNGLDPEGIIELRELLRALVAAGHTVLLSSHQLGEVARTADDVGVLAGGRLVHEGPLAGLAPDGELERAYLALTRPGAVA